MRRAPGAGRKPTQEDQDFESFTPRQALQKALSVLGPLRRDPDNPYALDREEAQREIEWLAHWHTVALNTHDDFPTMSATEAALGRLVKSIDELDHAMEMPQYAWELMNRHKFPEGTTWGWEDKTKELRPALASIKAFAELGRVSAKQQARPGGGHVLDQHGTANLWLAKRCRALLRACDLPHGQTKDGPWEQLTSCVKAYAVGGSAKNSRLRNDIKAAALQSEVEALLMFMECLHRGLLHRLGPDSIEVQELFAEMEALSFECAQECGTSNT